MLRAYELNADALLKGTKVDGLYTDDPKKKSAKFIPEITYQKALESNFKDIMDNAALGLALDNSRKIPIHIFNIFKKGNLLKVLQGKKIGSKIY
jgi:uridylate kinase